MAKAKKKSAKEVSSIFHNIMKASVAGNPIAQSNIETNKPIYMLYEVKFKDGEPVSAKPYIPEKKNFPSGQYVEKSTGVYVYEWRIVVAISEEMAIKAAKN